MDQVARDVVAAAPYTTDADLRLWLQRFGDECKALAANGDGTDWNRFKDTLTAWTEDDIPTEIVQRFVESVEATCSTPMDVLKQIGESGEDLSRVYTENLGWVSAGQRAQLDQLHEVHGDWRSWLPYELDDRWPDWRAATPDVLAPWLDEILPSLVLPSGAAEETEGTEGAEGAEGADAEAPLDESVWTDYLKQWDGHWDGGEETWQNFADRFVYYAPDGWHATAEELIHYVAEQPDRAATLTDVYGITVAHAGAPAAEAGGDVRTLEWVTQAQAAQLDELWETRGDWREWLPLELDLRMPDWAAMTAEQLPPLLDDLIPLLALPSPELAEAERMADVISIMLQNNPEMAGIAAKLSPEQFGSVVERALVTG